jgi:hypothetical protein
MLKKTKKQKILYIHFTSEAYKNLKCFPTIYSSDPEPCSWIPDQERDTFIYQTVLDHRTQLKTNEFTLVQLGRNHKGLKHHPLVRGRSRKEGENGDND